MLQKCYWLRGKALGNGCASSPIFTYKWFGLGKTAARTASDHRLLGRQWHAWPLSNHAERDITGLVIGFVHPVCGLQSKCVLVFEVIYRCHNAMTKKAYETAKIN